MVTRRTFVTVPALAAGVGLSSALAPTASVARTPAALTTYVGGRRVLPRQVMQWEARRIQVAAHRLANHLPTALLLELDALLRRPARSTTDLARDRALLAAVKMEMGDRRIRRLFATDLALSTPLGTLAGGLGAWSISRTRIVSSHGTARGFVTWFAERGDRNDQRVLLEACPDHYLLHSPSAGRQEVVEVTGGAVLASRFFIDYADNADLPVPAEEGFPVQLAGWARSAEGRRIGAVRHQFRNLSAGGMEARLAIAFPATLPPWMVTEHRWHLACEFSHWISRHVAGAGGAAR